MPMANTHHSSANAPMSHATVSSATAPGAYGADYPHIKQIRAPWVRGRCLTERIDAALALAGPDDSSEAAVRAGRRALASAVTNGDQPREHPLGRPGRA